MTAILAVPELPPPVETAPETAGEESQSDGSFSKILAAMGEADTEVAEETPESNDAAFPLTTPTAAPTLRLFGLFEFAPAEFTEETSLSPLHAGAELAEELAQVAPPPAPAADPELSAKLAFELEVQAASVPESPAEPTPAAEAAEPMASLPEAVSGAPGTEPEMEEVVARVAPREAPEALEAAAALPEASLETPRESPGMVAPQSASRPLAASPAPPQRAPEAAVIRELPPIPEPPRPVEAPRVALRLEAMEGNDPVDVVVAQRGPSLHFSVHSADGRLGAEMRASLGDLTERLEGLGYRTASPVEADRAQSVREPAASERSWSDGGGSGNSAFAGEQKRQGRRDRNQWRLEMENQSHGERRGA